MAKGSGSTHIIKDISRMAKGTRIVSETENQITYGFFDEDINEYVEVTRSKPKKRGSKARLKSEA